MDMELINIMMGQNMKENDLKINIMDKVLNDDLMELNTKDLITRE